MTSTIRDLTELLVVAPNDYVLISDTSDLTNRDKRISQANLVGGALSGGGTLATGGFTLTVPATGIAALKSGTPLAGRVAGWLDANTLQDGGFALSDIARLSVAQTFTGSPTFAGAIRGGNATINDQSFVQFTPALGGAMIFVCCFNLAAVAGIATYRTNTYMTGLVAGASMTFQNGALNGTTGVNGKATVGIGATDIYIENRLGSARSFNWLIFG